MFHPETPARTSGGMVTFEPSAHTAWHSHPIAQILIVTSGHGCIQRWGEAIENIDAGDAVWIAAGEKHWHGATSTTSMSHIAIQESLENKNVDWAEQVSVEQYNI